jgi:hypothetical protein
MKNIANIGSLCMSFGLAVFAGALLFTGGPLTVLGYIVAVPLFAGSLIHFGLSVKSMIPEKKEETAAQTTEAPAIDETKTVAA